MSSGTVCRCPEREKPLSQRAWVITCWKGNVSAFNGYRKQYSDYCAIHCNACSANWRSKAAYAERLALDPGCR